MIFRIFAALVLSLAAFTSASRAGEVTQSPAGHFEFHADQWISLHHFLYHAARSNAHEKKLSGRVPLHPDDIAQMTPEIADVLTPVFKAYDPYLEKDLIFSYDLTSIADALAVGGPSAVTDKALRNALLKAMPIYKTTFWPRHRAASEALISKLTSELEDHEASMAARVANVLENEWQPQPIRVDVSAYAIWAGAYTRNNPNIITLSADDEEVAGDYGFEVLFHESAHTVPLGDNLEPMANAALAAAGVEADRFWHSALFFATAQSAKDEFGDPSYITYSEAVGLTERPNLKPHYEALKESWDKSNSLQERLNAAARLMAEDQSAGE